MEYGRRGVDCNPRNRQSKKKGPEVEDLKLTGAAPKIGQNKPRPPTLMDGGPYAPAPLLNPSRHKLADTGSVALALSLSAGTSTKRTITMKRYCIKRITSVPCP